MWLRERKAEKRKGGVERRNGKVEIHSPNKFFSPAVSMYDSWGCCVYYKGLLDRAIHTQLTYTLLCVLVCVCPCPSVSQCLPIGVGCFLEPAAKGRREPVRQMVTEAYRRVVKKWQAKRERCVCVGVAEQGLSTHTDTCCTLVYRGLLWVYHIVWKIVWIVFYNVLLLWPQTTSYLEWNIRLNTPHTAASRKTRQTCIMWYLWFSSLLWTCKGQRLLQNGTRDFDRASMSFSTTLQ